MPGLYVDALTQRSNRKNNRIKGIVQPLIALSLLALIGQHSHVISITAGLGEPCTRQGTLNQVTTSASSGAAYSWLQSASSVYTASSHHQGQQPAHQPVNGSHMISSSSGHQSGNASSSPSSYAFNFTAINLSANSGPQVGMATVNRPRARRGI